MDVLKFIILVFVNFLLMPIYLILFVLSSFISFIPIYSTRLAMLNLTQRLKLSKWSARKETIKIYMNYFFYVIEAFILIPLRLKIIKNSEELGQIYKDLLKERFDGNKFGLISITSHIGNFEATAHMFHKTFRDINHPCPKVFTMAKPPRIQLLKDLLEKYRRLTGNIEVIWNGRDYLKTLPEIATNNSIINLLSDQKPQAGGEWIEFFGEQALFPSSGLKHAMQHPLVVVYIIGFRKWPGVWEFHYKLGENRHLAPILDKNAAKIELENYVKWLEQKIRAWPSQWSWDYKKWPSKTQHNSKIKNTESEGKSKFKVV